MISVKADSSLPERAVGDPTRRIIRPVYSRAGRAVRADGRTAFPRADVRNAFRATVSVAISPFTSYREPRAAALRRV